MSNLEESSALQEGVVESNQVSHELLLLQPRKVKLSTRTGVTISRTLPHKDLKKIGAWVFLDAYGPTNTPGAMQVAAHPHTGLQTVTWLFSGSVLHNDSLGTQSTIRSGELNLMTAGFGIAHSELSLQSPQSLQGVQLWVALPDQSRNQLPHFEHHDDLPTFTEGGIEITVFMGELHGRTSPAATYFPLVGAQLNPKSDEASLALNPEWEHGFQIGSESAVINGMKVEKDELLYLAPGIDRVSIDSAKDSTIILIGGKPFPEKFVMWWNFIGRSHEEIVEMRNSWERETSRFPAFSDSFNERIPAPEMPNLRLTPR
jgi:hypothetical protein